MPDTVLKGKSPYVNGLTLTTTPGWHMARRATMNANPKTAAYIDKIGYQRWIDEQLNERADNSEFEEVRERAVPFYGKWGKELRDTYPDGLYYARMTEALGPAFLLECWLAGNQLRPAMTALLLDLLSIDRRKANWGVFDHFALMRKHALGTYEELLKDIYATPSIHFYLDNNTNRRNSLNENLGRELLELHTVGSQSGYDDVNDVIAAAKVLSGFTGNWFQAPWHVHGEVQILGWHSENKSGTNLHQQLQSLLTYLANHEATARRVAKRMVKVFVSDKPVKSLEDRLTEIYLREGTAFKPMLRELFLSQEFKDSVGQKLRRPQQVLPSVYAIGGSTLHPNIKVDPTINRTWVRTANLNPLTSYLGSVNHNIMEWSFPDGYPRDSKFWISSNVMLRTWGLGKNATLDGRNLVTEPDYAKAAGIAFGKDRWVHVAPKLVEGITGWKLNPRDRNDREILNGLSGLMYSGQPGTKPNPYRRATKTSHFDTGVFGALILPHMLIS